MYSTKSFCVVESLIKNLPGEVSGVGELTTYAKTFTRDLGVYAQPARPNYTLMNFVSSSDETGKSELPVALIDQSIEICHFIVNKGLTTSGQIYHDELLADLVAWASDKPISQISIGPVQEYDTKWFPDWVRFKLSDHSEDNENTIWFAIDAFVAQYTDYEIVVVPPLDNLDLFFTSYSNIQNLISSSTVPQTMDRIQEYKSGNPETILRSDIYEYINPLNSTQRIDTIWSVLIHGPAGNNIDAIKDALVDYILDNSEHTRQEWTQIFPDIFKRTEFILAPHWQSYAIPNMTLQHGVYSPISNPQVALNYIKQVAVDYAQAHVEEHTNNLTHPYRSLGLSAIGSPENRDQLFEILQVFPDYINVPSTSVEFNRMSPETQAWVLLISEMIIQAETINDFTTMPHGYMKMRRGEILYIVKTYGNIQYLVASKRSIYDLLGLDYNASPQ